MALIPFILTFALQYCNVQSSEVDECYIFLFISSDLQLKTRHQPYKLCRQWQDLLYRFTNASEEDISQGETRDFGCTGTKSKVQVD